ncbi:MAG TPA: EamA family transporter [Gaiellaceae bacterium]|nr:EamA family transporter [Gaiellaceae bacterium]
MSAAAVLLALASAAVWGTADFSGGLVSRRLAAIPVTVISQAAGSIVLLAALAIHDGPLNWWSFRVGLLAGLGGGVGLAAFYRALSLGTMSIVSPVVACGAVVPFAVSVATGERPPKLGVAGAVLAVGGAVLASSEERRAAEPSRGRAVALAVLAAVALGLFTYFLGLGSREGSPLSTLTGARAGSLTLLVLLAAGRRESLRIGWRWLAPVAAIGLLDITANVLFALASRHGLLALVSVLGSLYPVMTILLAYSILGERLSRPQLAGVAAALAGVAALSAAG